MTATPDPAGVITPVLPLRQPPRRLLLASSTKASASSAASASSFRSRAADLVVRAPISPSAIRVRHHDRHAGFRRRYHPFRSPRATALAFSRRRGQNSRPSPFAPVRPRAQTTNPSIQIAPAVPRGDAAKRQRLPRSLAATASLGGEAAPARSPRAPRARVLSPQRPQKGADRHRSRQSGHLRARLPRAGNPATERRSSRPARGPPDVMSCDDRSRRCRCASSCVIAPELPLLPSPRRLLRASSTTASKRRAASTSLL